ncbi:hypothetical protein DVH24_021340 [Malus domestica]|uniref:Protein kinase domain-containing protein n=1 Tax=Malus domestica TaxID=3750 RepID=A0A498JUK6_MALDO|nr:hypothetical protein DVH24_021340 [Malus domestica]
MCAFLLRQSADIFLPFSQRGSYQVAKWNGTKVSVKILDKDCYTDPESINAFKHELELLEKGDLGSYLQKKGRLSLSKALRFALGIAKHGRELSS